MKKNADGKGKRRHDITPRIQIACKQPVKRHMQNLRLAKHKTRGALDTQIRSQPPMQGRTSKIHQKNVNVVTENVIYKKFGNLTQRPSEVRELVIRRKSLSAA